jgi:hypothetical protein
MVSDEVLSLNAPEKPVGNGSRDGCERGGTAELFVVVFFPPS